MPKLKYQRERRGSIIERQLEDDVVTLYQPIEELGVGKHGSVRAFASATDSVKFAVKRPLHPNKDTIHKLKRKRRYLGRYFAHPMMQNRRAKRDDYKPSAVRVTQRCVP
ncbi:hypothetical protein PsalN5692_03027 [Piscirickettsia salmonis]|uniref:hypothetical protein n=1 Tax=Piscirickettsia salmonis TaxID=1238 RepID=UPI001E56EA5A|nr:hypothetical protein [Piscirickettsia salmonis]QGP51543.1 hypothetical protein PsalN5692_03027 [Piscirickettsia salmonis]